MLPLSGTGLVKMEWDGVGNLENSTMMPSKEVESFWIRIRNPSAGHYDSNLVGKFMVFVPLGDLDKTWEKVYKLTVQGKLGCSSKASTARPNPKARDQHTKVVIIYTSDYNNLVELARVAWVLFEEGIFQKGVLNYKTDEATQKGLYAHLEQQRVSLYSIPFSEFQACRSRWELIDVLKKMKMD